MRIDNNIMFAHMTLYTYYESVVFSRFLFILFYRRTDSSNRDRCSVDGKTLLLLLLLLHAHYIIYRWPHLRRGRTAHA